MATDTDLYWIYRITGQNIQIHQISDGSKVEVLDGYNIRLPSSRTNQLHYPLETITNGMKIQGTAFINTFVDKDPNELDEGSNPSLTEVDPLAYGGTYNETNSHVNASRLLCLAIIDYLKAMTADMSGSLEIKEYYMKQFFKKLADNESNKRKINFSSPPSQPYACV